MMGAGTNQYLARRPLVLGLSKIITVTLAQSSVVQAAPLHASALFSSASKYAAKDDEDPSLWLYLTVAAILVLLGGAFAGLTIALMGQDEIYLQVIKTSGEGAERKHAAKVLTLLNRGKHWVLVTLLLGNVITNETLPIVLDRSLGGGWPAVLGSTVLIVIFGEIAPQSVCVRYGLPIGSFMSPFVLVLMYILAPIAWPTAKLLDWLLGEDHGTVYKKAGLKTLVSLHKSLGETGQQLNYDEVTIISAVLDLKDKSIGSIMTPMEDVFTMSLDDVLDEDTMDVLLSQGYSRIPIHHPDNDKNFVGMLLVKMLITYDPEDAKPVREFALATLPETRPDTSCLDIVNFFQEGKSHMVLVSTHPGEDHGALGVVTLEDVIEELIGEEIVDESDVFVDVHKAMRRMTPAPRFRIPKGQVVEDNNGTVSREPDLIDIAEDNVLSEESLQRERTVETNVKPKAAPVNRRRSSATDSATGNLRIPSRSNPADIREQLKHLGPSNLASRPKTTRYNTVKIKPGTGQSQSPAPPNKTQRMPVPRRISETVSEYQSGIGEGIVSTGGKAASDGVQTLHAGYGSFGSPTNSALNAHKGIQAGPESLNGTSDDERRARSLQRASSRNARDSRSGSTIRSLPKNSRSVHSRGPARSGSITENVVDVNGVRKIVLETTSSSDSIEEDSPGVERDGTSPATRSDDANKNRHDELSNGVDNAASKGKKRRRKKPGPGTSGESQPLLE